MVAFQVLKDGPEGLPDLSVLLHNVVILKKKSQFSVFYY